MLNVRIASFKVLRNITIVSNNQIQRDSVIKTLNTSNSKANFVRAMGSSNCKSFSPSKSAASNKNRREMAEKKPSCSSADEEYVEGYVCKETDIAENEMKSFDLKDEGLVLLVKQKGKLSAIGAKCTHYGAPLASGALSDGRVRCQWHGACFNITTGDIEDFPGLDSLPCYQVSVENGCVKVRAKKSELQTNKRVKPMSVRICKSVERIVCIGGGPSGATFVEALRQEGYTGQIVMLAKENYLPYDRVKVSKALDFDIDKVQLRTNDFYKDNGIDVMVGAEAVSVDFNAKSVKTSKGDSISYDSLYIATGSRAIKAPIEGADLTNVLTMRDIPDSKDALKLLQPENHVVILGASFIGLEMAAYCINKVKSVIVVARDTPLKSVFGEEIGARVQKMFEEKGVQFILRSGLHKCIGENGILTSVELIDCTVLPADLCIMGIGSVPFTEFLKDSDIKLEADGSITVDNCLQTNIPGVYAGGDIAYAPVYCNFGKQAAIGHYPLAGYHGKIAALNIVGKKTEMKAVPYFWTMLFGKSIRYAGYGKPSSIEIKGDLEEMKIVAFYFDSEDRVISTASIGWDPVVSQYAELLSQGRQLYKKDLSPDPFAWCKTITP